MLIRAIDKRPSVNAILQAPGRTVAIMSQEVRSKRCGLSTSAGSVCQVLEPIPGRARQHGLGHDQVNRDPRHEFGETPFPYEGMHKKRPLECGQYMSGATPPAR